MQRAFFFILELSEECIGKRILKTLRVKFGVWAYVGNKQVSNFACVENKRVSD